MAEEKKQDGEPKGDPKGEPKVEARKKKALPVIAMVAAGAILGGAGVVFAVPPKEIKVAETKKPLELVDVTHPDYIEHAFNPKSKAGRGIATMKFKFIYTVREDRERDAFEQIKTNWDLANSNTLCILTNRSIDEFNSEAGLRILEKDLIDDLDRTVFPTVRGEKLARVTRVIWNKRLYQ